MTGRILVDLLGFTGSRGGTETYAREITTRLPVLLPGTDFVALTGRAGTEGVADFFPGEVRTLRAVGAGKASWALGEILATDATARRTKVDLIWTPANFGPVLRGVRRVVTVHDVIYHEVEGADAGILDRAVRSTTSWLMARSARTADAVIAVSGTAAHAIGQHLAIPTERITVVHNGSTAPDAPADPWRVLHNLGIGPDRPFVLSTGNRMPHKNFEGMLRALAAIPADRRPLAVVPGGPARDPLVPRVAELGLQDHVLLPGWVTDAQLEALYSATSLYICPSLSEGFGLPVVDAMRRGAVVLANDLPVLREVGGTSAMYADATSAVVFGRAIERALLDPTRHERSVEGRAWAEGFTWDASADGTARVLAAAMEMPPR